MLLLSLTLSVLLSRSAGAVDLLDYWSYEDYTEDESMVGVDSWATGYASDEWYGYRGESGTYYVYPTTDRNTGDSPGDWGDGGAIDDWFVNRHVELRDGVVRAPVWTQDDDALGVVCRFENKTNMIIGMMTGNDGSSPVDERSPYLAIVKIEEGVATVLESTEVEYPNSSIFGLELSCNDGEISLSFWETYDSEWTTPDDTISATDDAPPAETEAELDVGFYSYDSGSEDRSYLLFGVITALQTDDDSDGVGDDNDNCETTANSDQADGDSDGLGDACDPDGGGDTGGGDDTGGGTDSGGGTGGTDSGGGTGGTDSGGGTGGTDTGGGTGGTDTGGGTGGTDTGGGTGGTDSSGGTGGTDTGTPDTGDPGYDVKIPDGSLTSCGCSTADRPGGWLGFGLLLGLAGLRRRR